METLQIQPMDEDALQLLRKLSDMGIIKISDQGQNVTKPALKTVLKQLADFDETDGPLSMDDIQREVDAVREKRIRYRSGEDSNRREPLD